jgi:hypothetical protein
MQCGVSAALGRWDCEIETPVMLIHVFKRFDKVQWLPNVILKVLRLFKVTAADMPMPRICLQLHDFKQAHSHVRTHNAAGSKRHCTCHKPGVSVIFCSQ